MIPEDIFFTNDFTEVGKQEDGGMVAPGFVSEISALVVIKSP